MRYVTPFVALVLAIAGAAAALGAESAGAPADANSTASSTAPDERRAAERPEAADGAWTPPIPRDAVVTVYAYDSTGRADRAGSGFFVRRGRVITNCHTATAAAAMTVTGADGRSYRVEGIVAEDAAADIIMLAVDAPESAGAICRLSTREPAGGEKAYVAGGYGLSLAEPLEGQVFRHVTLPGCPRMFETTHPATHGMSGAPLFDASGEVAGVIKGFWKTDKLHHALVVPAALAAALSEHAPVPVDQWSASVGAQYDRSAGAVFLQGTERAWEKDHAGAAERFTEAVRLDPSNALARFYLGLAEKELGRTNEAIEAMKSAISLDPDLPSAHANLAALYGEVGDIPAQMRAIAEAVRVDPGDAGSWYTLGRLRLEAGDLVGAMNALREASRLAPDVAEIHATLGVVYMRLKWQKRAVASFTEAIRINPALPEAHYNLGMALVYLGRNAEAAAAFRSELALDFQNADARLALALTYLRLDRRDLAMREYEALKEIDPEKAESLRRPLGR